RRRHEIPPLSLHDALPISLIAYVEDRLGEVEREIAESHLAVCGQCAEDARDLRAFKAELAASQIKEETPPEPLHVRSPTLWEKLDRKSTRLNSSHVSISYA